MIILASPERFQWWQEDVLVADTRPTTSDKVAHCLDPTKKALEFYTSNKT
jgi:hypothetical protein